MTNLTNQTWHAADTRLRSAHFSDGNRRKALITGISGQDAWYLARQLLARGYEVHGFTRGRLHEPIVGERGESIHVHSAQSAARHALTEGTELQPHEVLTTVIRDVQPDELYHFAADSFVPRGWEQPIENLEANAGLTIRILEDIRNFSPHTRLLNACSREIFGGAAEGLVNEQTELRPISPYGINKAASRWTVNAYRERYSLFATNAILFNHESPRRGEKFVTRKITKRVAEIATGTECALELGNLQARRDWGFAGDYVDAMWRMLQIDAPEDFVLGTGITHSIEEFAARAFARVGLDWRACVRCSDHLVRSHDPAGIAADISKAKDLLGWTPQVGFAELVCMMVDADLERAQSATPPTTAPLRRAA